ncbi:helix-turn-helix domain-containing protein [Mycobacteroides abscessus]|uniref:helix-turn-helix domain-containing protein n=1 Tax=Mycobacteroides abscessus TaxID=36809 RepID=UPI0034E87809
MADNTADFFSAKAFRRACEQAGTTKKAIAAELGVTPTTLSSLLNGRSTPSMKLLIRMVDFFGGSLADFLEMPPRQQWELKHYRVAAGLTQAALAHELGVTPSAVSGWELGKYPPGAALVPRMAQLFGISDDQLRAVLGSAPPAAAPTTTSANETLSLAETLAETVLGFAASAAAMAESLPRRPAIRWIPRSANAPNKR